MEQDKLFLEVMKSIEDNNNKIKMISAILEDMVASRKKLAENIKDFYLTLK